MTLSLLQCFMPLKPVPRGQPSSLSTAMLLIRCFLGAESCLGFLSHLEAWLGRLLPEGTLPFVPVLSRPLLTCQPPELLTAPLLAQIFTTTWSHLLSTLQFLFLSIPFVLFPGPLHLYCSQHCCLLGSYQDGSSGSLLQLKVLKPCTQ